MRVISSVVIVVVVALAGVARAQPGMQQPGAPYPVAPQPYPMVPPPYAYAPMPQLTVDERELLADGEITDGEQVAGGLAAIFIGFGVGQAIEHRWHELGWVFTLGEAATFGLFLYGMSQEFSDCFGPNSACSSTQNNGGTYMLVGALGLTALRIWETVDAFTGPRAHNVKLRELRARVGVPPPYYGVRPYVIPTSTGDGALAGLALRF